MKRFEYKIHVSVVRIDSYMNLNALNDLGREGWEAVGVIDNEKILLKREI